MIAVYSGKYTSATTPAAAQLAAQYRETAGDDMEDKKFKTTWDDIANTGISLSLPFTNPPLLCPF